MLSKTGRNVAPLSTDFHTPPDAAPRYQTRGLPGTPLIDATRPPSAGPIIWKRKGSGGVGATGAGAPRCCACPTVAATISVRTTRTTWLRIALAPDVWRRQKTIRGQRCPKERASLPRFAPRLFFLDPPFPPAPAAHPSDTRRVS